MPVGLTTWQPEGAPPAVQTTLDATADAGKRQAAHIAWAHVIANIGYRHYAFVTDDGERLVLWIQQATGDARGHTGIVLDAADREIGRHGIDRNAFVSVKAGR